MQLKLDVEKAEEVIQGQERVWLLCYPCFKYLVLLLQLTLRQASIALLFVKPW